MVLDHPDPSLPLGAEPGCGTLGEEAEVQGDCCRVTVSRNVTQELPVFFCLAGGWGHDAPCGLYAHGMSRFAYTGSFFISVAAL